MNRTTDRLPAHRTAHHPTRHTPATTSAGADLVYLQQQMMANGITLLTPAEIAARRHTDQILYTRWVARHAAIAERDRKARRFWLGLGAVVGLGLLAACAIGGWLLYRAADAATVLAVLAVAVVLVPALYVGGHKCVTVVQHWH
jgi:hypothetical protein